MPIYCYRCNFCGGFFEVFCVSALDREKVKVCKRCFSPDIERDYMSEKPLVRGDIPPGFDSSIGRYYTGRRDRYTKYRESGHYPISGGGHMGKLNRSFYGDEKYYNKVMRPYDHSAEDRRMDEMIAKQLESGAEGLEAGE